MRGTEGCNGWRCKSSGGCAGCETESRRDLGIHQNLYARYTAAARLGIMYRDTDDQLGLLVIIVLIFSVFSWIFSARCRASLSLSSLMSCNLMFIGAASGVACARGKGIISSMFMNFLCV